MTTNNYDVHDNKKRIVVLEPGNPRAQTGISDTDLCTMDEAVKNVLILRNQHIFIHRSMTNYRF